MCGFLGFTNTIGNNADDVIHQMMDKIVHRGPDSEGAYVDDDVALGFRRLSIIDLEGGDQPIFNEDRSLVLVFNGEIYNFMEIREELLKCGHEFKTNSDSEVLIHGYEQYGENLVEKLRGMFAFAIWDKNNKTLFAARDPFGIKPFYYTFIDGALVFGSEIKGFYPHPAFKPTLNEKALSSYLSFQYSPGEETFFSGVYKLLPAHCFTLKNGKMEKRRYWHPEFTCDGEYSLEEYADIIDDAINESVDAHKISDVEVGSFLSSGIDSSYIASAAKVDKTFTVGFGEDIKYNEIGYAKEFSEYIDVENISEVITPEDYWGNFGKIQYHMDEPLADPAAVALYFVSKLASQHVKVVLSGEGADELFGGYKVYQEPVTGGKYTKLPFAIRRLISKLASCFPEGRGFNFFVRRGKTVEEWFIGNANIFSKKLRKKVLKNDCAPAPMELCSKYYDEVKGEHSVTKMQYLDIHMWLMGDILLKADKMSMANSLELRVPFLDKKVMELAQTIPVGKRVNGETTKVALRMAAKKTLPDKTAKKPKLGFPVPIRVWLKEDKYYTIVKDAFISETAKKYFNTKLLIKLLDEHKNGKKDNSRKIWTVYTFLVWYKEMGIVG
ncbi:MAG: asparagine synthase (glutamine-hydrolyzing) [Clostridia bacterium]|nr:asparagine synthase (glutamine-hydrolyzing) [Clostridia bacterium]MEE1024695.1 asparagine synthase (glutamine-hydrolyzing) [Acutalibacteraceae bacterium]